jgi:hypothetical protein
MYWNGGQIHFLQEKYKSSIIDCTTHLCSFTVCEELLLPMALQPGVGLGLLYNVPPGLSIPCSVFPFI